MEGLWYHSIDIMKVMKQKERVVNSKVVMG